MLANLLALAMLYEPAHQPPCDLRVHVVDASSGRPLQKIAVNLRLGASEARRTVQQETDASGATCFTVPKLIEPWTSVDAFSTRYISTHTDPLIRHLPDEVTIRMRHLSWIESLKYVLEGD